MKDKPSNRIAVFLDDRNSSSVKPLPAQRELSKPNSSTFHRPGKNAPAKNALDDELRSCGLLPPVDNADFDRDYKRVVAKLRQELGPVTSTEEKAVESLAHDYVVSDMVREMIEAILRLRQLSERDARIWHQRRECRQHLSWIQCAIADYEAGKPWCSSEADAIRLAERLARFLAGVESTLEEDQNPGLEPLTPEDIEEREPMMEMLAIVGPDLHELANSDYLARLLMGRAHLTELQRQHVQVLLEYCSGTLSHWLKVHPDIVTCGARCLSDELLSTSASDPGRLVLLQQYLEQLEQSIRRQFGAFRRR